MDYRKLIENLTPDIYQRLRRALELGKWPDGVEISEEQKAICMEAVISWEAQHVAPEQRTGYIDLGSKGEAARGIEEQVLQLADEPGNKD